MTREETKEILMIISSTFPNWKPQADFRFVTDVWYSVLKEYDGAAAKVALKAYIATETVGFAPSPGQLIEKINALQFGEEMSELEAWSYVSKAICNAAYHAKEEWEALPEQIKKCVSPELLRSWSLIEADDVQTVIQSHFSRTYRERRAKAKEQAALPESVKKYIEGQKEKQGVIPCESEHHGAA